jgi:Ca2+-binding RTX toxin-like protein
MASINGTSGNDTMVGTTAAESIFGGDGNDTITGLAGNDSIYGGKGTDTAKFSGAYSDFKITALYETQNFLTGQLTGYQVTGPDGTDMISSDVEYVFFNGDSSTYLLSTVVATTTVTVGKLLTYSAGKDVISGTTGNDTIDGGADADTVIYSGVKSAYAITNNTSSVTVSSGADGTDTLTNIERIQFSDMTVALDISGVAGQAYRVYQAAFNRTPDNGGLKYWIGLMDGGYTLAGVASGFIASTEFKTLYGSNPTNELLVSKLYDNVLHRTPDEGGYNYWVGLLNTKKIDTISTLINFSESTENQAGVIGVIQNGINLLN